MKGIHEGAKCQDAGSLLSPLLTEPGAPIRLLSISRAQLEVLKQ